MVRLCVICNPTRQQEKYHLTSRPSAGRQAVSGGGEWEGSGGSWVHPHSTLTALQVGEIASALQMGFWEVAQHHIDSKKQQVSTSSRKAQALSRTMSPPHTLLISLREVPGVPGVEKQLWAQSGRTWGGGVGQEPRNLSPGGIATSEDWIHRGQIGFQQTWQRGIDCLPIYWAVTDIYPRRSVMIWFMYILKLSSQQSWVNVHGFYWGHFYRESNRGKIESSRKMWMLLGGGVGDGQQQEVRLSGRCMLWGGDEDTHVGTGPAWVQILAPASVITVTGWWEPCQRGTQQSAHPAQS